MLIKRKLAGGMSAAAIAVGCMIAGSAGLVATPAFAATSKCSVAGKNDVPKCKAKVGKHKVKAGHKVKVKVGKSFKKHEKVAESIKCPHQKTKHIGTKRANKHGKLNTTVKIPKSSHGHCKLIFKGKKDHSKVTTKITVKK